MDAFESIFATVNSENLPPVPLTPETVDISLPTPSEGTDYNTEITVSAKPNSGYYGSVVVYYTRIDLDRLGEEIELESEIPFTVESLLEALNTARASQLTQDEIETVVMPDQTTGVVQTVTLTAKSQDYKWQGTNTLSIVIGMPHETDLLHHLLHVTLPGADYF